MKYWLMLTLVLVSAVSVATPLPTKPHIYVEGSAEIEVIPDQMIIAIGLSAENMEVAIAKTEVDDRSHLLIETLKKMDIAARDIATTALQVTPVHDYVDGKQVPRGSRVYRQVEITLRNLERYGELMQALMDAEISNTVNTRLNVSNEKQVGDQALVKALDDARERASALLASQGKKLGGVYSISEFEMRREESYHLVPNRNVYGDAAPEMVMSMSAKRFEPFEPGVIRAKAKVYVVYLIK
jgi:uncharacterized protein YggE